MKLVVKSSIVAILSIVVFVCHAPLDIWAETPPAPSPEVTDNNGVEKALRHSGEVVRAAKRPEDLDDVLRELSDLQRRSLSNRDSGAQDHAQQIAGALEFVRRWQEYLDEVAGSDPKRAREILEHLSSSADPGWIPRSQILRRMRDPLESEEVEIAKAAKEIVGRVKSLEDLNDAMAELEKLKPPRGYGASRGEPSIYAILEAFAPLNNIYRDFKAGLPAPVRVPERQERGFEEPLRRLRAELLTLLLPRTLELPEQIHANPGEGPLDFLRRIGAEAAAKNNYLLAARARAAEETIMGSGGSSDLPGARDQAAFFVRGNNQEAAGQFAFAVASYQAALATGSDLVPAKVIGERLSAIKGGHPAEFEDGSELFLSPPSPSYKAFNYTQMAPNPLEIFPKLQTPTPFPPPPRIDVRPNQNIRPVPLPTLKNTAPSPSPAK